MKAQESLSMVGGTVLTVNSVVVSDKAWADYCHVSGGEPDGLNRTHLAMALRGVEAKRMADGSVYFIYEIERLRYVFVTRKKNGSPYPEHLGHMYLTAVQRAWVKDKTQRNH